MRREHKSSGPNYPRTCSLRSEGLSRYPKASWLPYRGHIEDRHTSGIPSRGIRGPDPPCHYYLRCGLQRVRLDLTGCLLATFRVGQKCATACGGRAAQRVQSRHSVARLANLAPPSLACHKRESDSEP